MPDAGQVALHRSMALRGWYGSEYQKPKISLLHSQSPLGELEAHEGRRGLSFTCLLFFFLLFFWP